MRNTMEYKGYLGSIEISEKDSYLFGCVMGIQTQITYRGSTAQELVEHFHLAVDTYLDFCKQTEQEPERAYKGQFNVRIPPKLHRLAVAYATNHRKTLNSFVEESIREKLTRENLLV